MKDFIDLKCDYNLYKSFYAVAKLESFSAAAKAMFVSQPSISYNVKALEKQLGVVLLYRNSKSISLTPDGKHLFEFIENAHNNLIRGEKMLFDSAALLSGEISIGVPSHIATFYLTDLIKEFKTQHSNITFRIYSRSTREMIEMLKDNVLDLIVDSLPISAEENSITVETLGKVDICLAYKTTLPLDKNNFTKTNFILPNQYTETRRILNEFLKNQNIDIKCDYEVSTTEATLSMVLKEMGVGYFLRPSIKQLLDDKTLTELKFDTKLPQIELGYAYNKNFVSTATKKFIKLMEDKKCQNYD